MSKNITSKRVICMCTLVWCRKNYCPNCLTSLLNVPPNGYWADTKQWARMDHKKKLLEMALTTSVNFKIFGWYFDKCKFVKAFCHLHLLRATLSQVAVLCDFNAKTSMASVGIIVSLSRIDAENNFKNCAKCLKL